VVKGPGVTVRVDVSNFTLQRRGSGKRPHAGHIHYWIDDRTDAMTYPATTGTNVKHVHASGPSQDPRRACAGRPHVAGRGAP
jgi:hypothetical protein